MSKDCANCEVVFVPSTSEISHMYPLPQPPMSLQDFNKTKMKQNQRIPHLTTNPCVFKLNDISVGVINTDVIKDMCIGMCVKNPSP